MPNKVPLWVLEQGFCTFGSKMPPRPRTITEEAKLCEFCGIIMWERREMNFHKEKYYCDDCIKEARQRDPYVYSNSWSRTEFPIARPLPAGFTRMSLVQEDLSGESQDDADTGFNAHVSRTARAVRDIPSGNLDEMEYRFWVGMMEEVSCSAQCRGCSEVVFGPADVRIAHKLKTDVFGGQTCNLALVHAYARLLKKRKCVVCAEFTTSSKYGVPLCGVGCIVKWKFARTEHLGLELELMDERPKKKP